jgi:type IV pilus assembly protein PilN
MIKINLLPYRAQRKRQVIIDHAMIAGLALLPAVIGIVISFIIINLQISQVNNDILKTDQEIKSQAVSIEKINTYKEKKEALLKKMDVIKTLQKNKTGPVLLMDQLAVNLPGRLWLTELKQTGMELKIEGYALDNQSISKYMTNLEKSSCFKSVDLEKISTEEQKGTRSGKLKNFILKCQILYTGK